MLLSGCPSAQFIMYNILWDVVTHYTRSKPIITSSKLTIQTLEQGVKYVQS